MTRKTAFITVVASALVLAAPAWGQGQAVDPSHGSSLATTDSHDRAFAVKPDGFLSGDDHVRIDSSRPSVLDAHERGALIGRDQLVSADVFERTVAARVAATRVVTGDDRVRIDPADLPVSIPSTTSGREVEWPQLGLGLGLGLVLALGLFIAVRSKTRPLAH